jgi:hypothetical protein
MHPILNRALKKPFLCTMLVFVSDFITCREEKPPGLPHADGNVAFRFGF